MTYFDDEESQETEVVVEEVKEEAGKTEAEEEAFTFEDDNADAPAIETTAAPTKTQEEEGDENAKIRQAVNDVVSPLIAQLSPIAQDREVSKVNSEWVKILETYPEAKSMETKVKRWALTENSLYKGDVKKAFKEIAGEDFFIKVGAKRAGKAKADADADTSTGGSSTRPQTQQPGNGSGLSLVGKTHDEIQQIIKQVKSGTYGKSA